MTSRGNRGQAIFVDDADRRRFVELLSRISSELRWTVDAYCLMTNHYHLIVEAQTRELSDGMQRLNARYAQWFNRRHDLTGHLFRHRFYAGLVTGDAHLLEVLRYLALNPVNAGLCGSPEDWQWSSYGPLVTGRRATAVSTRVLSYFGHNEDKARDAFRTFVDGHS